MSENRKPNCPECVEGFDPVNRRNFLRTVSTTAATVAVANGVTPLAQAAPAANAPVERPAEALIRELHAGLTDQQRNSVVMPFDHRQGNNRTPTRSRMFNAPVGRRIGEVYTQAQQELVDRILRAMSSGDEGYEKLTRNGTFDGSRELQGCGAYIFGNPNDGQYAYVFMGHHLTVRCDGNSVPGAAFGGPMYYGHSPNGYSERNCFFYQTRAVMSVFDALNEQQRTRATVTGSPGEHEQSVQFRTGDAQIPGIAAADLTADQRRLVESVMREVLSPYRREDADEVMQIVRQNGGLERIHLAFYRDRNAEANTQWNFWRLEGPGFVWNYRVLPHVHTYVNIALARS